MADLSLLLDVVLKTTAGTVRREFCRCGLLHQLQARCLIFRVLGQQPVQLACVCALCSAVASRGLHVTHAGACAASTTLA